MLESAGLRAGGEPSPSHRVRVELKTLGFHQTAKPEAPRISSLHEQFR